MATTTTTTTTVRPFSFICTLNLVNICLLLIETISTRESRSIMAHNRYRWIDERTIDCIWRITWTINVFSVRHWTPLCNSFHSIHSYRQLQMIAIALIRFQYTKGYSQVYSNIFSLIYSSCMCVYVFTKFWCIVIYKKKI